MSRRRLIPDPNRDREGAADAPNRDREGAAGPAGQGPLPDGRGSVSGPLPDGRGSDQMLDLHKQLSAAKTSHDKTAIQRQIDATDRRIDQLLYELYGLTDDEIRIVEEAT